MTKYNELFDYLPKNEESSKCRLNIKASKLN